MVGVAGSVATSTMAWNRQMTATIFTTVTVAGTGTTMTALLRVVAVAQAIVAEIDKEKKRRIS